MELFRLFILSTSFIKRISPILISINLFFKNRMIIFSYYMALIDSLKIKFILHILMPNIKEELHIKKYLVH